LAKDTTKERNERIPKELENTQGFSEYCEDELVGLKSEGEIGYEASIRLNGH